MRRLATWSWPVDALGVDLEQDRDAVPGLLGDLGARRRVYDLNSFLDRRHSGPRILRVQARYTAAALILVS